MVYECHNVLNVPFMKLGIVVHKSFLFNRSLHVVTFDPLLCNSDRTTKVSCYEYAYCVDVRLLRVYTAHIHLTVICKIPTAFKTSVFVVKDCEQYFLEIQPCLEDAVFPVLPF